MHTQHIDVEPAEPPVCENALRITASPRNVRFSPPLSDWSGYSQIDASLWMLAASVIVILACTMRIGEHRTVYLPFVLTPIPESCASYRCFAIDCPGCGLTRTFIHLAHGRLAAAMELNPVGLLVFAFTIAQIPLGLAQVVCRRRGRWLRRWPDYNQRSLAILIVLLSLQWVANYFC